MSSSNSDANTGDMMRFQDSLPQLPVPSLPQTLQRYVDSLRPHLTPEQLRRTQAAAAVFARPGGDGERLQCKLLQRADKLDNWLVKWWTDVAYLGYRESVVINSSPGILYPTQDTPRTMNETLQFATKFIMSTILFEDLLHRRAIPVKYPLDMSQFFGFCGSCRVPDEPLDYFKTYSHAEMKHVIVAHNNQFFKLPVFHDSGRMLSEPEILRQLVAIVEASPADLAPNADECVGVLTSEHRDVWSKLYKRLRKDADNVASIEAIQSSMVMLCLDKPSQEHVRPGYEALEPGADAGVGHESAISHTDRLEFSRRLLHGQSTADNSANRWFDKTFQICMAPDGGAGCLMEHCGNDGASSVNFTEFGLDYIKAHPGPIVACTRASLPAFTRLKWTLDADVRQAITKASLRLNADIERVQLRSIAIETFGKADLKAKKQSTDGFIQVSLQLAYRSLHRRNPITYESVSTRKFKEGRTDTIRSCTASTDAFVSAVEDESKTDEERAKLMQAAISKHVQLARDGSSGMAHDRHLLGLFLLAKEEAAGSSRGGGSIPDIFTDPSYAMMNHITLSTSQVVCRYPVDIFFAPVAPDGYGIAYLTADKDIRCVLSCFKDCDATDIDAFRAAVVRSLDRCYALLRLFPETSKV